MEAGEEQGQKHVEVNPLDTLQRIIDRSDKEVDRVYKIYRILAGAITLILVIGIGTLGYVSYNSVKDMQRDLRQEMDRLKTRAAQEMNDFQQKTSEEFILLKNHLRSELEMVVTNVGKRVNQRIEDEFNKDNIQTLVNTKASERIDKVADLLIGQQVEKKIDPKMKAAEEKIKDVNQQVAKTAESIKDLRSETDFITAVNAAQNNDRIAFEKLKMWAEDKSFPFYERAGQAFRKVMQDHQSAFGKTPVDVPWKEGVDHSKFTIEDLRKVYDDAGNYKASVIKYVWERKDLTKKEKMQFLIDIIKSEKDLFFLEYAGRYFIQESKQKVYEIAYWEHLKWWDEHKDEIK
ncbi:MAG: hypothetical protein ABSG75_14760, partial [Syntrophales bacterium]|jgi:hypothetical protein